MKLYKKCNSRTYSLLKTGATLALDSTSSLSKNLSERIKN